MRERRIDVEGIDTFVWESEGAGEPVVFWHGNPTDADDWLPFMERLERPAFAADLPGFGRSRINPRADFDGGMDAHPSTARRILLASTSLAAVSRRSTLRPFSSGRNRTRTLRPSTAAAWQSSCPTPRSQRSRAPAIGRGSTAPNSSAARSSSLRAPKRHLRLMIIA